VTASTSTRALWYLTRGTGVVTLLLLTASVVLGIMESGRWARPRWPKLLTAGLHKNVSLLVLVFLAIHVVTSVADGFAPIGWLAVVVPFESAYRPLWLGLGAVSLDLLLAITITSLIRQRIGYGLWRVVHVMAYACWPVALLHGLGTGSDTRVDWVLALSLACLAIVVAAIWWRVSVPHRASRRWPLAVAASAVGAVAIVGWLMFEPLRPGWARRAGTPSSLLSSPALAAGVTPVGGASAAGSTAAALRPPFRATFQGTVTQLPAGGADEATVDIAGTLSGGASGALRVVLQGPALAGGGVEMKTSQATLGPIQEPSRYRGQIVSLRGTSMQLELRDGRGAVVQLVLRLEIADDGTATGMAQAR
jgi:hypothetical protein